MTGYEQRHGYGDPERGQPVSLLTALMIAFIIGTIISAYFW
jgi:hypothetical protein